MSAPPPPFHIIRTHDAPLSTLTFDPTNSPLYAGDQDGWISIIDSRSRRPLSHWKAHEGGVLGVDEVNGCLVSQGRDNKLHLYERHAGPLFTSGPGPSRPPPPVTKTLEINALNFCRFSICPIPSTDASSAARAVSNDYEAPDGMSKGKGKAAEAKDMALLAVPNLVDSELADVYLLPSMTRLHAALNRPVSAIQSNRDTEDTDLGVKAGRSGLIMGLHVGFDQKERLSVSLGYEDGRVEMWRINEDEWVEKSDSRLYGAEERAWSKVYDVKGHNEAVMAMVVDSTLSRAFTVSADHLVCRYDLTNGSADSVKKQNTGQIGNASVAISGDDKLVAVGGWDGNIRLFSTASLKPLGTLSFHRETVHTLAFAKPRLHSDSASQLEEVASTLEIGDESDDEDDEAGAGVPKERWLASGGKDKRIALWGLKAFV